VDELLEFESGSGIENCVKQETYGDFGLTERESNNKRKVATDTEFGARRVAKEQMK
jgi:hypothetical protein